MKHLTGTMLIHNGQVIDGTGNAPIADGLVFIRDGLIEFVGPRASGAAENLIADQQVDALGGTIMPGLVEAHFHPTYFNVAALEDLDIKYPVEYVTLLASCNARLAVECGYTSARSGWQFIQYRCLVKKGH
jgi:imidazolonepropionase-like amidohydrolase